MTTRKKLAPLLVNKKEELPLVKVKLYGECSSSNLYTNYYSAEHTNARISSLSSEHCTFVTAEDVDDESRVKMPRKKNISSKYFTADETNNQGTIKILPKKKRTNFEVYIEEIVKHKSHIIQTLDDDLIAKTPIDIFNDELFTKTDDNLNSLSQSINENTLNIENNTEPLRQCQRSLPSNNHQASFIGNIVNKTGLRICDNSMLREDNSFDFNNSLKNNPSINISNIRLDTEIPPFTLHSNKEKPRSFITNSKIDCNSMLDADVIFVDSPPSKSQKLNREFIFPDGMRKASKELATPYSNFSEPIVIEDTIEDLCKDTSLTQVISSEGVQNQMLFSANSLLSNGWLNKRHQMTFTCVICKLKFIEKKTYKCHLRICTRRNS